MVIKLFAVLSVFLVGCIPTMDFPATIYLDQDWSEEEIVTIKEAFQEWEIATDGLTHVEFQAGFPHPSNYDPDVDRWRADDKHVVLRLNSYEMNITEEHGNAAGCGVPDDTIVVDADSPNMDLHNHLFRTVLHEIGHLYGLVGHLEYSEYGPSLMNTSLNTSLDCIDQETLDWFCSRYDCPSTVRRTCL